MKDTVAIIGTGNVAWHFVSALTRFQDLEIFVGSRSLKSFDEFQTTINHNLRYIPAGDLITADYVIFCVPDDHLESMLLAYRYSERSLLIHTSGAQDLSIFQKLRSLNAGVIYPLQTLTKGKSVAIEKVPFCLECTNAALSEKLEKLARRISQNIIWLESKKRLKLHLAAVFASNFPNFMLWCAAEILQDIDMNVDVLQHLVKETMAKSFEIGPGSAQTGPAVRGDMLTQKKHLDAIGNAETKAIYKMISAEIQRKKLEGS